MNSELKRIIKDKGLNKVKLNIGCGIDLRRDCINIDVHKDNGADYIHKLLRLNVDYSGVYTTGSPLPFGDNEVDEILFLSVAEHFLYELPAILDDFYRVLKKGGYLRIRVPYGIHCSDLDHKRLFDSFSFNLNKRDVGFHTEKKGWERLILVEKKIYRQNFTLSKLASLIKRKRIDTNIGENKYVMDDLRKKAFITNIYNFLLHFLGIRKHYMTISLRK